MTRPSRFAFGIAASVLMLIGCQLFVKPTPAPTPAPAPVPTLDANAQLSHDVMVNLAAKYATACDQVSAQIKANGKITRNDAYTAIQAKAVEAMKPDAVFQPVNQAIESKIGADDNITDSAFFDSLSAGYKSVK
jgi:hypothetical protein